MLIPSTMPCPLRIGRTMTPLDQAPGVIGTLLTVGAGLGAWWLKVRNGNGRAEKVITVKLDTEDHDRQVRMEQHMEQHNLSSEKILEALQRIEVKQGP